MSTPDRRRTLLLAGGALAIVSGGTAPAAAGHPSADAQVAAILQRIKPPHFPDRW